MWDINLLAPLLLLLLLWNSTVSAAQPETRVMFDQHFNWLTPQDTERTLNRIKEAGFNVFVPCVWIGRGTSWPSALAPAGPEWEPLRSAYPDPLKNLIERAHAMSIEVHPLFTVTYRTRDFMPQFHQPGTPQGAFDIHQPAFRRFIADLMLDVVRRYDIDGLNLDYVRSQGICASPFCVRDYAEKTKRDLLIDKKYSDARPNAVGQYPEEWESLRLWNNNAVNALVQDVTGQARLVKPKLIISVDSIADNREFRVQGADAVDWANRGWIDVIYHMDYGRELQSRSISQARARLHDKNKLVVLLSNVSWPEDRQGAPGAFPRDASLLIQQLAQVRQNWPTPKGVAVWTYRFFSTAQATAIRQEL